MAYNRLVFLINSILIEKILHNWYTIFMHFMRKALESRGGVYLKIKRLTKVLSVIFIAALTVNMAGCKLIKKSDKAIKNTVLAKVGESKITRGDLDKYMHYTLSSLKEQYGNNYENDENVKDKLKKERDSALETLVEQDILLKMKEDKNIKYSKDEMKVKVSGQIDTIKEYCGSDKAYKAYIAKYGYNTKSFKEYLEQQYILDTVKSKLVEGISVSDKEIKDYYDANIENYVLNPGAYVKHIVFKSTTTGYDDANKAKDLAKSGKSLEDIAKMDQFKDNCTYEDLGHQDFDNNTKLVADFVNAFKGLAEGDVSEPVETNYGWHIIEVSNINKEAKTQSLDEVKEAVKKSVLKEKQDKEYKKKVDEYQKKIDIKIYKDRY